MKYTFTQSFFLVALRIAIGWHLLYEGLIKVTNPSWTSKTYLLDSQGFMKGFFEWIAENDSLLATADFVNIWGLTLIGLLLIIGLFSRISAMAGAVLLLLYYLSHPPLIGVEYLFPSEGSYFIVNKTLIEVIALLVLFYFPSGKNIGFDRLICGRQKN
ncbi:DoxX family membrane protein [Bacteroidota bacterium]